MREYLRIAVSMFCLTACMLLIVLWVRSYAWRDELALLYGKSSLACVQSHPGRLVASLEHEGPDDFSEEYYSRLFHAQAISTPPEMTWQSIVAGFKGRIAANFIEIQLPYWFLVMLGGTLATVPWIERSYRYGLRTMFIAMTLLALLLGMIAILS